MKRMNEKAPLLMILQRISHLTKYQAALYLEHFQLKPGQAGVLFTLKRYGGLTQRQLAEKVGITPPSMTVSLRKLEEKGYIRREADAEDQRKMRITLNEKGALCVEDMKKLFGQMEDIVFQGFQEEEKMLLRRFLLQMEENALNSRELKHIDPAACLHADYMGGKDF